MANGKVSYRARAAAKKNAEKAEQRRKDRERKEFLEKNGKKIALISCVAVVAIVAVFLLCKLFVGPGGSIPNFFGTLRGVGDNWIVTNLNGSKSPRYYKLATFDAPEGYQVDPDFKISTDKLNQTVCARPVDENSGINYIYVAGVAGRDAATMMNTYAGYNLSVDEVTAQEGEVGGHPCHYAYVRVPLDEPQAEGEVQEYYSMVTLYTDTIRDSSVVLSVQSVRGQLESLPSEDVLMAEAEKAMACLQLP